MADKNEKVEKTEAEKAADKKVEEVANPQTSTGPKIVDSKPEKKDAVPPVNNADDALQRGKLKPPGDETPSEGAILKQGKPFESTPTANRPPARKAGRYRVTHGTLRLDGGEAYPGAEVMLSAADAATFMAAGVVEPVRTNDD